MKKGSDYQKFLTDKIKQQRQINQNLYYEMEDHKKKADQLKGQILKVRKSQAQYKRKIQQLCQKLNQYEKRQEEQKKIINMKKPSVDKAPRQSSKLNKAVQNKNKTLAENIVEAWKKKQQQVPNITRQGLQLLKTNERKYLAKIKALQQEIKRIQGQKQQLIEKNIRYQRALSIKGSQFVNHLKQAIKNGSKGQTKNTDDRLSVEESNKLSQILELVKNLSETKLTLTQRNIQIQKQQVKEEQQMQKKIKQEIKNEKSQSNTNFMNLTKTKLNKQLRKPPPIVKKNVFGYFQNPQFNQYAPKIIQTRHPRNSKFTQTLSDDLSILITRPVIEIIVFDANIKPQRNRARTDYYVRLFCSLQKDQYIDTPVKFGFEPLWNYTLLMKQYDFPFLHIQLMNQGKGIRDYGIGKGKTPVSAANQKIVKIIDNKKEFQGRVRLGIRYPKGTIFQFTVTSVQLIKPESHKLLKQTISICCPLNPSRKVTVIHSQFIVYCDLNFLIPQSYTDSPMIISALQSDRKGKVSLELMTQKQGDKQIEIKIDEGWKVILRGHIVMIMSQQQEPQKIIDTQTNHRYFSVRASHPVISAEYSNKLLLSSIKFPLVFRYLSDFQYLKISKDKQEQPTVYEPLLNQNQEMIDRQFIKVPKKVYQLFLENIEGEKVSLVHNTGLLQRMLKEIKLRVGNKQFFVESQDLMQNYYKIIQRTFKKIGYFKFKLGYKVFDNELKIHQNQNKQDESIAIKDEPIANKIELKDRYLTFQVTSAYLPQFSNTSKYSCKLQGRTTIQLKGNSPRWQQDFIVQYEETIQYELIQHGFIGEKTICKGCINLKQDTKILRLGVHCVRVGQHGVLYFGKVTIPNTIYNLLIKNMSSQIQQEADWIGEIDPYIRLFSMNRQLYKSSVVEGGGRRSNWKNVNFNVLLASNQVLGYLYDEDIIGKDDYLGEFRIEIGQKSNQIKTKIVKQGKIGGSITLNGQFEGIKLQNIEVPSMLDSLAIPDSIKNKRTLYRVKIYGINLTKNEYQDDIGWIQISNPTYSSNFFYTKSNYQEIDYNLFVFQEDTIKFKLYHHSKSFFSNKTAVLGESLLIIPSTVIFTKIQIDLKNQQDEIIGQLKLALQPIDNVKIGIIGDCTSAFNKIIFQSDQGNRSMLFQDNSSKGPSINNPLLVFYHKQFRPKMQEMQEDGQITINQIAEQSNQKLKVYQIINKEHVYSKFTMIVYEYERKKFPNTQGQFNPERSGKQFEFLKWQPYYQAFNSPFDLQMLQKHKKVCWNARNNLIQSNSSTSQLVQHSEIRKQNEKMRPFLTNFLPQQIKVYEGTKQLIKAKGDIQKSFFIDKKGILYYKLISIRSQYTQIKLQWVFIRFSNKKTVKETTQMVVLARKCQFSEQQINQQFKLDNRRYCQVLYSNLENIGQDGYFGQDLTFLIPGDKISKFNLIFIIRNRQNLQQLYRQTLQIGCRVGPSYPILLEKNHNYSMHCFLKTFHHESLKTQESLIDTPFIIDIRYIEIFTSTDYSGCPKVKLIIDNHSQILQTEGKQTNFFYKPAKKYQYIIQNQEESQVSIFGQIWLQGILTQKTIGSFQIKLKKKVLSLNNKMIVSGQIKYGSQIQGRVNIEFMNQSDINFLQLSLNSLFLKDQSLWTVDVEIISKLRNRTTNKTFQRSKNSQSQWFISNSKKQSLILLLNQNQEGNSYKMKISSAKGKKILGEFNLTLPLIQRPFKKGLNYPISESLRQGQLNGIFTSNLKVRADHRQLSTEEQPNSAGFVRVQIYGFSFIALTNELELLIESNSRILHTKPRQLSENSQKIEYLFNVEDGYQVKLSLVSKKQIIGVSTLDPPMVQNEERILRFYNPHSFQPHAICKVKISHILGQCMQIVSLQAQQLINTEYLVDMTPYLELKTSQSHYITEIGKGRNGLFWKVGLIEQLKPELLQIINVKIKEKDMFFDDYIGEVNIDMEQQGENQYDFKNQEGQKTGTLKTKKRFIAKKSEQEVKQVTQQYIQDKAMVLILNKVIDSEVCSIQFYIDKFSLTKVSSLKPQCLKDIPMMIPLRFKGRKQLQLQVACQNASQTLNTRHNIQISSESIKKESFQNKSFSYQLRQLNQKIIVIQEIVIWSTRIQAYSKKKIVITNNERIMCFKQESLKQYYQSEAQRNAVQNPIITTDRFNITFKANSFLSIIQKGLINITVYERQKDDKWAQCLFQIKDLIDLNKKVMETELKRQNKVIGKVFLRLNMFNFESQYRMRTNKPKKSNNKWYQITIKRAEMYEDIETFSKMDPYCILKYGKQQFKTSIQQNVGKNPVWNQTFMLQVCEQNKFMFILMDSQIMKDRQIGQCFQKVPKIQQLKQPQQFIIPVLMQGKEAGKLYYNVSFVTTFLVITNIKQGNKPQSQFSLQNKGRKIFMKNGTVIPVNKSEQIIIVNDNTRQKRIISLQELTKKQQYLVTLNNANISYMVFE